MLFDRATELKVLGEKLANVWHLGQQNNISFCWYHRPDGFIRVGMTDDVLQLGDGSFLSVEDHEVILTPGEVMLFDEDDILSLIVERSSG